MKRKRDNGNEKNDGGKCQRSANNKNNVFEGTKKEKLRKAKRERKGKSGEKRNGMKTGDTKRKQMKSCKQNKE